jgi:hypothetical protein
MGISLRPGGLPVKGPRGNKLKRSFRWATEYSLCALRTSPPVHTQPRVRVSSLPGRIMICR